MHFDVTTLDDKADTNQSRCPCGAIFINLAARRFPRNNLCCYLLWLSSNLTGFVGLSVLETFES